MDKEIRKLQRLSKSGDQDAARLLEAELNRIGRYALVYRGPVAYEDQSIEEVFEEYFDETWFHKKMSWGYLHRMSGCMKWCPPWCCWPYSYQFVYRGVRHRWARMRRPKRYWGRARPRPGSGKGKFNNSKRKTLRTHRDGSRRR